MTFVGQALSATIKCVLNYMLSSASTIRNKSFQDLKQIALKIN